MFGPIPTWSPPPSVPWAGRGEGPSAVRASQTRGRSCSARLCWRPRRSPGPALMFSGGRVVGLCDPCAREASRSAVASALWWRAPSSAVSGLSHPGRSVCFPHLGKPSVEATCQDVASQWPLGLAQPAAPSGGPPGNGEGPHTPLARLLWVRVEGRRLPPAPPRWRVAQVRCLLSRAFSVGGSPLVGSDTNSGHGRRRRVVQHVVL